MADDQNDWYADDGTFLGPWWLRWAFLAVSLGVPVVWVLVFGSIRLDGLALWIAFMAAVNLLRAPG
jgi:hypothetical protein